MSRPLTPAEQQRFKGYFPSLDVTRAGATDNATHVYNCIAWTVGITNAWIWPGPTLASFDAFYSRHGLHRAGNGPVAVWGDQRQPDDPWVHLRSVAWRRAGSQSVARTFEFSTG